MAVGDRTHLCVNSTRKRLGDRVILTEVEDGYVAECVLLRGCMSQGDNMKQAVKNIKAAIKDWKATGSKPIL